MSTQDLHAYTQGVNPFVHHQLMSDFHQHTSRREADLVPIREEQKLSNLFDPHSTHSGWQQETHSAADFEYDAFQIPNERASGIAFVYTGCESNPALFTEALNKLRNSGLHVIAISQLNTRQSENNYQDNFKILEHALLDKDGPVQKLHKKTGLPINVIGHSAGVQLMLNVMTKDQENMQTAAQSISTFGNLAGFLGSYLTTPDYTGEASVARRFMSASLSKVLETYSHLKGDAHFGSTAIEKAYTHISGKLKDMFFAKAIKPTMGDKMVGLPAPSASETLLLRKEAHKLMLRLKGMHIDHLQTGMQNPLTQIKMYHILAENDQASCNRTNAYLAKITGSQDNVHYIDSNHSLLGEAPIDTVQIIANNVARRESAPSADVVPFKGRRNTPLMDIGSSPFTIDQKQLNDSYAL